MSALPVFMPAQLKQDLRSSDDIWFVSRGGWASTNGSACLPKQCEGTGVKRCDKRSEEQELDIAARPDDRSDGRSPDSYRDGAFSFVTFLWANKEK